MTPEIEHWLAPMVEALLASPDGSDAFGRLMDTAMSPRMGGVDWIGLGQMMRRELAWTEYPPLPSDPTG